MVVRDKSETSGMTRSARDSVDASRAQSLDLSRSPSSLNPRARHAPPPPSIALFAHAHPLWTDSPGNMLPVLFVLTRRQSTRRVGGPASSHSRTRTRPGPSVAVWTSLDVRCVRFEVRQVI